jgi:hypothetical protein
VALVGVDLNRCLPEPAGFAGGGFQWKFKALLKEKNHVMYVKAISSAVPVAMVVVDFGNRFAARAVVRAACERQDKVGGQHT